MSLPKYRRNQFALQAEVDDPELACLALAIERRGETRGLFEGRLDPFSSAIWFAGFAERTRPISLPDDYKPPRVAMPQTWLLLEGWKRAKPISVFEVPGARR